MKAINNIDELNALVAQINDVMYQEENLSVIDSVHLFDDIDSVDLSIYGEYYKETYIYKNQPFPLDKDVIINAVKAEFVKVAEGANNIIKNLNEIH